MTAERPQNDLTVSTYELIDVPPAPGMSAGTIKKLYPEKEPPAKGSGHTTLGVPLRSHELAGQSGGRSRKIVDTNTL